MAAHQSPPNPSSALPFASEPSASNEQARRAGAAGQADIEPVSIRGQRALVAERQLSSDPRASQSATCPTRGYVPRSDRGGIYQTVRLLEKKHGAFFISRIILASGINLRTYDSATHDDPVVVAKFLKTLRTMLSEADLNALLAQTTLQINR